MTVRSIIDIDPNFRAASVPFENVVWRDALGGSFDIRGLYKPLETGTYQRLPLEFADDERLNAGARRLMFHTAGGRIRFTTNSPYVAVAAELPHLVAMPHMPLTGSSGIDLYEGPAGSSKLRFRQIFRPEWKGDASLPHSFEGFYAFPDRKGEMREIELYLPLYNPVSKIRIGLAPDAVIGEPHPYACELPVLVYGASVTQGGCASRPGNSMPAFLGRMLNVDFISITFSGSAKGEPCLAEYLKTIPHSVFIYDYDGNAPDLAYLESTHWPFYEIMRSGIGPNVPVIMISLPSNPYRIGNCPDWAARRDHIMDNYLKARRRGDCVEFIDGENLYVCDNWDDCTVDGVHPNDLGFRMFAERIRPMLAKCLGMI